MPGVRGLQLTVLLTILSSCGRIGYEADAPLPGAGADRIVFWTDWADVATLTDAELDAYAALGVDGFVMQVQHLSGLGGAAEWTPDGRAEIGDEYAIQRTISGSNIVARARARGIELYLGFYLVSYFNTSTPLAEWFDDAGWAHVHAKLRELAGAAHALGLDGLALDHELYPQNGGVTSASWAWSHPGNTRAEAEVRAMATQRGEETMAALVEAFPGVELLAYALELPGDFAERVREEVHGVSDGNAALVQVDFWNGMARSEGYGRITMLQAVFYKTPHITSSWDHAMQFDVNRVLATLSRRWDNWDHASSRLFVSPFAWIDEGPMDSTFYEARPPEYVRGQLRAMRRWGMGGLFGNRCYADCDLADYDAHADALREASQPGVVDTIDPTIEVTPSSTTLAGTASDDMAVRVVRWRDDAGGTGAAQMTWAIDAGDEDVGFTWHTEWTVPAGDLAPGATSVTVTAEDIKGRVSEPVLVHWPSAS